MLRKILTQSLGYGVAEIGRQAVGVLLLPLYARFLSPREYGIVSVLAVASTLLGSALAWGVGSAVLRFLFIYREPEEQRTFLTSMVLMLMGVSGLVCFVLSGWGGVFFETFFPAIPARPFLPLVVWTAYCSLSEVIPMTYLLARQHTRAYTAASLGIMSLRAVCIMVMVAGLRRGAVGKLEAELIAGVLTTATLSVWFSRNLGFRVSRRMMREVLAFGWPLVGHQIALWTLHTADRMILQRSVSFEQVAIYSVGYTLGYSLNFFSISLCRAWSPHFLATAGQPDGPKQYARQLTVFTALLGGIVLGLGLFSRELIALLAGPTYAEAARVMPWILIGYFAFAMYQIGGQILHFVRAMGWLTACSMIAAAANILLNVWWIPRWGIMGAVAATVVAFVSLWGMCWSIAFRKYPAPVSWSALLAWGSGALAALALGTWAGTDAGWWSVALRIGIFALYAWALIWCFWIGRTTVHHVAVA